MYACVCACWVYACRLPQVVISITSFASIAKLMTRFEMTRTDFTPQDDIAIMMLENR